MAKKVTRTVAKKKKVHVDPYGRVFIQATFNNIIVSITNANGQVVAWSSAGKMGFKGSKKNTPYAASQASQECAKTAYDMGMRKADVQIKGPGAGREAAIRTINNAGIEITSIHDITPIPHNGCRPPKKRRV
jgi:small subunit ribosomal protein S11